MSKWRPTELNCIYVIPDIHGKLDQLQLILKRILPLRKSDGGKDTLIFLGDYVDRDVRSHLVLDLLIKLKEKYKDQIVFIKGNHEEMFLNTLFPKNISSSDEYMFWMKYGGEATLLGYLYRNDLTDQAPYSFPRNRIIDLVPKEHIKFMQKCINYHEIDDFIFVHGGCDPTMPLDEQDIDEFKWDRSLCTLVKTRFAHLELPWKKTVITGHNTGISRPIFRDKFYMLDDSAKGNLLVMEARSREIYLAKAKKDRLIKVVF